MTTYTICHVFSLFSLSIHILYLAYVPYSCNEHLDWAFNKGKNTHADEYYPDITDVVGVTSLSATRDDFQRYFKCKDVRIADCNGKGLTFPASCSVPPCNQCYLGNIINPQVFCFRFIFLHFIKNM